MKVLQINSVSGIRSTGRICLKIAQLLEEQGDECKILFGRESAGKEAEKYSWRIGSKYSNILHYLKYVITDDEGSGSYFVTKRTLQRINEYKPDIIHIHNLHGHYINYNVLMDYLTSKDIPVVFSLYDCWMFTGDCTHFDSIGCKKWKAHCEHCPMQIKYPLDEYMIDSSRRNFDNKREKMSRIKKKIISPGSYWLESVVKDSFLKEYPIYTVQSGIDLTRFQAKVTDIKDRYNIDKQIVLLVASQWSKNKGVHYLPEIINRIAGKHQIVVIGQLREDIKLGNQVIHIQRTDSIDEMVAWYSAADVYVNITLQETLGLTNVEALACGTPVVTFDSGGCKECIDESCGIAVKRGDIEALVDAIRKVLEEHPFSKEACRKRSLSFDDKECYKKYLNLYDDLLACSR